MRPFAREIFQVLIFHWLLDAHFVDLNLRGAIFQKAILHDVPKIGIFSVEDFRQKGTEVQLGLDAQHDAARQKRTVNAAARFQNTPEEEVIQHPWRTCHALCCQYGIEWDPGRCQWDPGLPQRIQWAEGRCQVIAGVNHGEPVPGVSHAC